MLSENIFSTEKPTSHDASNYCVASDEREKMFARHRNEKFIWFATPNVTFFFSVKTFSSQSIVETEAGCRRALKGKSRRKKKLKKVSNQKAFSEKLRWRDE